jgi:hypothetical protein
VAIKIPRCPPLSPFDLPRKHRLATEQFVAEVPPPCRYPRPILPPPMSPASLSPSYLTPLPLALLPDLFSSATPQRNGAIDDRPKHTPTRAPPTDPLSFPRKQSRSPSPPQGSPRPPASCRDVTVAQNSSELAGGQLSGHASPEHRQKPNPR